MSKLTESHSNTNTTSPNKRCESEPRGRRVALKGVPGPLVYPGPLTQPGWDCFTARERNAHLLSVCRDASTVFAWCRWKLHHYSGGSITGVPPLKHCSIRCTLATTVNDAAPLEHKCSVTHGRCSFIATLCIMWSSCQSLVAPEIWTTVWATADSARAPQYFLSTLCLRAGCVTDCRAHTAFYHCLWLIVCFLFFLTPRPTPVQCLKSPRTPAIAPSSLRSYPQFLMSSLATTGATWWPGTTCLSRSGI